MSQTTYLKNLALSGIAALGLYTSGCTSIPASDDRNLGTYRAHMYQRDISEAHDALVCSQIGSYRTNAGQQVVVLAQHAAQGGLFLNDLESRMIDGQWQSRDGDVDWTWSVDRQGMHTSKWYSVLPTTPPTTPQVLKRYLAAEQVWTTDSDTSTIKLYEKDGSVAYTVVTDKVSRGKLQSRFYAALRNSAVRRESVPYRVGRVALRQTLGMLDQVPVADLLYPDDQQYFEVGEQDNVGGALGYYAEPESPVPFPLSTLGLIPRLVTRAPIALVRSVCGDGLEVRKQEDKLTAGDSVGIFLLSLFDPLDRAVKGAFGIDKQLYQLATAWPRVGNEILVDDQVEAGLDVTKKAVLASLFKGGSSHSAGTPLAETPLGPGIGGGEEISNGIGGK